MGKIFRREQDPFNTFGVGLANALYNRTQDAYSFGVYYQPQTWLEIIQWLLKKGYSPFEVEMIVRSKLMRWAGTSEKTSLKRFISYNKDYKNFAAIWKSAIDEFLMTDVYKSPEKKKQYMEDFGYDDNGNLLKEEAMGGVSAPMATLNNTPGMGNAVPAGVDKVGSGDTWGDKPKKKKKKKLEEDNINPYDKLGTAMAKKMGIKMPFKKKKDPKNQNSMTMKAEQFRIMPYEEFKNLYENKNSKT